MKRLACFILLFFAACTVDVPIDEGGGPGVDAAPVPDASGFTADAQPPILLDASVDLVPDGSLPLPDASL